MRTVNSVVCAILLWFFPLHHLSFYLEAIRCSASTYRFPTIRNVIQFSTRRFNRYSMQNPPIDEHAFYRGVLVLLGITGSVGLATSVLHYLEPEPELMDLVIPPLVSIANLALTIWLICRPKRLLEVVYSAFAVAIAALSLPAWYYSLRAYQSPEVLLIDIFPPISSFLIILIVLVMVILPPRRAFPIMIVAWVLSALPVLGYLLTHREELWSARGQEMFMGHGFCCYWFYCPFNHGRVCKLNVCNMITPTCTSWPNAMS